MAKTTVALTADGTKAYKKLGSFNMPEIVDLVRLGFAFAVTRGFDLERPDDFGALGSKGKYTANTGTLDPDRKIEGLVQVLYGELDEPYLAIETLANKGLLAIAEALDAGAIDSISDILLELEPKP